MLTKTICVLDGCQMLTVLGGLPDVEPDLIHTRTAEGPSRTKALEQRISRKSKLTSQQQAEAPQHRAEGATLRGLADNYNVGVATISSLAS